MLYTTRCSSPLGVLTLASDGDNLVGLWMDGQKYFAATVKGDSAERADLPVFALVKDWLAAYFAGKKPAIAELPLAPAGSAFRKAVWALLCEIPYGQVTTYGAIAKALSSHSAQAIGNAVGHNPISIIIPCHRVVGASGSLTGYAGGLERKVQLLRLEGMDTARFFVPARGTAL